MSILRYDQLYKNNQNVFGTKPNFLLKKICEQFNGGAFLDLGCGQGRDSKFMLKKGFNVTAIDNSSEGIKSLQNFVKENNVSKEKCKIYCKNIIEFKAKKRQFDIINANNVFHFTPKKEALELIAQLKKSLNNNGYFIISNFTTKDSLIEKPGNEKLCYFEPRELEKLFLDFKILYYKEKSVNDTPHTGAPKPHKHHIVLLLAQKV